MPFKKSFIASLPPEALTPKGAPRMAYLKKHLPEEYAKVQNRWRKHNKKRLSDPIKRDKFYASLKRRRLNLSLPNSPNTKPLTNDHHKSVDDDDSTIEADNGNCSDRSASSPGTETVVFEAEVVAEGADHHASELVAALPAGDMDSMSSCEDESVAAEIVCDLDDDHDRGDDHERWNEHGHAKLLIDFSRASTRPASSNKEDTNIEDDELLFPINDDDLLVDLPTHQADWMILSQRKSVPTPLDHISSIIFFLHLHWRKILFFICRYIREQQMHHQHFWLDPFSTQFDLNFEIHRPSLIQLFKRLSANSGNISPLLLRNESASDGLGPRKNYQKRGALFLGDGPLLTKNLPFMRPHNNSQLIYKVENLPPIGHGLKAISKPWRKVPPQWRIAAQMGVAALVDVQAYGMPPGYYYRFFKKLHNDETSLHPEGEGIYRCITSNAIYRCPGPGCAAPSSVKRQKEPYVHLVFCPLAKYKNKSIHGQSYSDYLAQEKRLAPKKKPPSVSLFFKKKEKSGPLRSPNRNTNELLAAQASSPDRYRAVLEPEFQPGEKVQILCSDGRYWWPGSVKRKFIMAGTTVDGDKNDLEIYCKRSHHLQSFISDEPVPAEKEDDDDSYIYGETRLSCTKDPNLSKLHKDIAEKEEELVDNEVLQGKILPGSAFTILSISDRHHSFPYATCSVKTRHMGKGGETVPLDKYSRVILPFEHVEDHGPKNYQKCNQLYQKMKEELPIGNVLKGKVVILQTKPIITISTRKKFSAAAGAAGNPANRFTVPRSLFSVDRESILVGYVDSRIYKNGEQFPPTASVETVSVIVKFLCGYDAVADLVPGISYMDTVCCRLIQQPDLNTKRGIVEILQGELV